MPRTTPRLTMRVTVRIDASLAASLKHYYPDWKLSEALRLLAKKEITRIKTHEMAPQTRTIDDRPHERT